MEIGIKKKPTAREGTLKDKMERMVKIVELEEQKWALERGS